MSAEVRIATGEKKGVLVVPARAVLGIGRGRYCSVNAGKELVEREVVTGASDGTNVEITAGLQEGDVSPGRPVRGRESSGGRKPAKGPPGRVQRDARVPSPAPTRQSLPGAGTRGVRHTACTSTSSKYAAAVHDRRPIRPAA